MPARANVDLHAVHEIRGKCGLQNVANVRMVVTQAREALPRVKVEVGATRRVVEVGPCADT